MFSPHRSNWNIFIQRLLNMNKIFLILGICFIATLMYFEGSRIIYNQSPKPWEIESDLKEISSALKKLLSEFKEIESVLKDIEPKLRDIEPKLRDIEPKLRDIEPKLRDIEPDLNEVEPDLNEVEPDLIEVEPDLKEIAPNTFVYSAFLETRMGAPYVRLIGMAPIAYARGPSYHLPKCYLIYKSSVNNTDKLLETNEVQLSIDLMPEYQGRSIAGSFFQCGLKGEINFELINPIKLVMPYKNEKIEIPVKKIINADQIKKNLSVCVRPFFGPYNDIRQLAEFLTYYLIMGANHFVFYDYETSSEVINYLRNISGVSMTNASFPVVEILPWSLPKNVDVHELGQLTAINDCLYRQASRYKYVAVLDVDEYIVPKQANDLLELIKLNDSASVQFRSSFFCKNSNHTEISRNDFRILNYTNREKFIFSAYLRSKYIAKPSLIEEGSYHYVTKFIGTTSREIVINPNVALLNHYRGCRENQSLIRDESILRFKNKLMNAPEISAII